MKLFLFIFFSVVSIAFFIYITNKKRQERIKSSLVTRFRKRFKSKNRLREKLIIELSESLMADPESNIKIGIWDKENELREKADIHRARLSKFGHSTMNGEKIFKGPEGGVYKYTDDGKRKYI